jgi:hypothetical protein
VTGNERLAWTQSGNTGTLRFIAYVNGTIVRLDAAECRSTGAEAECSSPLPPLGDGVQSISVAAVSMASGETGPASAAITVQRVAAQGAAIGVGLSAATDTVTVKEPFAAELRSPFAVRVFAQGFNGPLQLAPTRDGRVFVAEADGHIRMLTAATGSVVEAYDMGAALNQAPLGTPGVAVHPDFPQTPLVYLSFLTGDDREGPRLRIVRVREVAGVFGEAATLYDGPIVGQDAAVVSGGPRLAFSPGGLLHALLPRGLRFDDPTVASWPHAALLRLTSDGDRPDEGPLGGITTHPLALTWRPGTTNLWGLFADTASMAAARPIGGEAALQSTRESGPVLHLVDDSPSAARALVLHGATPDTVAWAQAFMTGAPDALTPVRLSAPILVDPFGTGTLGEVADLVVTRDGVLLVAMNGVHDTNGYILSVTPAAR